MTTNGIYESRTESITSSSNCTRSFCCKIGNSHRPILLLSQTMLGHIFLPIKALARLQDLNPGKPLHYRRSFQIKREQTLPSARLGLILPHAHSARFFNKELQNLKICGSHLISLNGYEQLTHFVLCLWAISWNLSWDVIQKCFFLSTRTYKKTN